MRAFKYHRKMRDRHAAQFENRKSDKYRFPLTNGLFVRRYNALEQIMNPRNVGSLGPRGGLVWRNGLSRKIWNNPHRYYRSEWPPTTASSSQPDPKFPETFEATCTYPNCPCPDDDIPCEPGPGG
jgi:hypothetical protein